MLFKSVAEWIPLSPRTCETRCEATLVIASGAKSCHPERKYCHPERSEGSYFRSFANAQDDNASAQDNQVYTYHDAAHAGFTLMEILIALFVFSIVSLMLATSLHHIISVESATEKTAARLRNVQMSLILLSHDIGQAINRPIMNASNHEEAALVGDERAFSLTHDGIANPLNANTQSSLARVHYSFAQHRLWYARTEVLDAVPQTQTYKRVLLDHVQSVRFSYLTSDNHFVRAWPYTRDKDVVLPRAIRITIELYDWGELSQLYLLPQTTPGKKADAKS